MVNIFWEDLVVGTVAQYGPYIVTREEILTFAGEFDPQPMHLDEEAARSSMLGGLAASGWHVCAILMRMLADGFVLKAASWGAPGVEEVRWVRPVRPGDHLTLRIVTTATRILKSRPAVGLTKFNMEMFNQSGNLVMTMIASLMLARRYPGDEILEDIVDTDADSRSSGKGDP